jgi:hypothetical protein
MNRAIDDNQWEWAGAMRRPRQAYAPAVSAPTVRAADLLSASARTVLQRVRTRAPGVPDDTLTMAQLIGPVITQILTAQDPLDEQAMRAHAATLLRSWSA